MTFSPDFRRLLSFSRLALVFLVALLAVWIAGDLLLLDPAREEEATLERRKSDLDADLQKVHAVEARLGQFRDEVAKLDDEMAKLEKILPPAADAESRWKESIGRLATGRPLRLSKPEFGRPSGSDFHAMHPVTLEVSGPGEAVASFASAVAGRVPLTFVKEVELRPSGADRWTARIRAEVASEPSPATTPAPTRSTETSRPPLGFRLLAKLFALWVGWRLFSRRSPLGTGRERLVRRLAFATAAGEPAGRAIAASRAELSVGRDGIPRPILDALVRDLDAGSSLGEALAAQPKFFAPWEIGLAGAARATADPVAILRAWSETLRRLRDLRARAASTLIYPVAVLLIASVVLTVLLWKVDPTFSSLSTVLAVPLPAVHRFIVDRAPLAGELLPWVLGLVLSLAIALRLGRREPTVRLVTDRLALFVPLWRGFELRRGRLVALEILQAHLGAGSPIDRALGDAARAQPNRWLGRELAEAASRLAAGDDFAASGRTALFDGRTSWALATALASPDPAGLLRRLVRREEEAFDRSVARTFAWLEPAIIIALGLVVGAIVVGTYGAMFAIPSGVPA